MKNLTFRSLVTVLLCVFTAASFTSCSDDEKKSDLVGTWQNQAFIYRFNSDGSGYFQYAPTNGAYVDDERSNFRWNASDKMLSITFDGSGTTYPGTHTYVYEVKGSLLVMVNMESGDINSFTKK